MRKGICLLSPLLALSSGRANAGDEVAFIKAGHLVGPESSRLLDEQNVVIRAGMIEAVGTGLAVPAGARVIDLSAYTVLPGLFDVHTHLVGDLSSQDPVSELRTTAAELTATHFQTFRKAVSAGVKIAFGTGSGSAHTATMVANLC